MTADAHKPDTPRSSAGLPGKGSRHKIDTLMEQASKALVHRRYFEAERLALQALRKAHALLDYERMARILLPLQEARRQKRDLAIDACGAAGSAESKTGKGSSRASAAGKKVTKKTGGRNLVLAPGVSVPPGVFVVDGELPGPKGLRAGCYLVSPPRVGVDGRTLRELADKHEVPIVVTVREPTTQAGLWPVVAVGPVTLRAKVPPPLVSSRRTGSHAGRGKDVAKRSSATKGKAAATKADRANTNARGEGAGGGESSLFAPGPEWFLAANEALGDAAIAAIPPTANARQRVQALMERLEAMPDHEKLHQALAEAAREAAHEPAGRSSR